MQNLGKQYTSFILQYYHQMTSDCRFAWNVGYEPNPSNTGTIFIDEASSREFKVKDNGFLFNYPSNISYPDFK